MIAHIIGLAMAMAMTGAAAPTPAAVTPQGGTPQTAISQAATAKAATPAAGVYSDVEYIREAGDFIGVALEYRPGPKPAVVFTDCEGGCSGGKTVPVTVTGNTIVFDYCEQVVDQTGKASCNAWHYTGVFRADGRLVLTLAGSDEKPDVLRRLLHAQPHYVERLGCGADHC